MSRASFRWIPLGLLVVAAGCTMCASTYDECGPTFAGGYGQQCRPYGRAGSNLSGGDQAVSEEPTVAEEPMPPDGYEPAPRKVLSVTDRKVEQSAQPARPAGDASQSGENGWKSKAPTRAPSKPTPVIE